MVKPKFAIGEVVTVAFQPGLVTNKFRRNGRWDYEVTVRDNVVLDTVKEGDIAKA